MKVPLKWLAEYVPLTIPVAELVERLTLAGLEVSGVRLIGVPAPEGLRVKSAETGPVWPADKIVAARVQKVEPHPDPAVVNLKLPTVEYGQGRTKQLVTGAPNLKIGDSGQTVILALAGSVLFSHHAKGSEKVLQELKPAKIRGIPSDAMVCSAFELGIDDDKEAGIIRLDEEIAPGTPAVDFMGDIVLELEITPNMARCLSVIGVAREVAALTGQNLRLPPHQPKAEGSAIEGQVRVSIEDPSLCARYAAMLLKDVGIGPSPEWMQRRLSHAGMRPISNIVDITNYVLLEWGQPLHAFDYDKLRQRAGGKAPHIIVRPARAGETLATLDEGNKATPLKLTPEMLIIADEAGPIALAGVKGGADTMVTESTRNVLLESANFDFLCIRRTMKMLNLPSEASVRFSKGIHPETVKPAAERAAELMRQYGGATVCRGIVDVYPRPFPPKVVDLKMSEVRRILGMDMPRSECVRILRELEFQVEEIGADALRATVPPHRIDVEEGAADVIEDLVRLYGYDKLPATLLADQLPPQRTNQPLVFEERVRDRLVALGLQEVITYALTTEEHERPLAELGALTQPRSPDEYVRLQNPISSEREVMRHSLLAGVLDVAAANLQHTVDVRLFEIGSVYLPRPDKKLPDEPRRLAIVLCGVRQEEYWGDVPGTPLQPLDLFDGKGILEALLADLHVANVAYRPMKTSALHPGRAAELVVGERMIGCFGELHPKVAEAFNLGGRAVLVGEIDLEALRGVLPARHLYQPVPRFPAALRDLAVIVEESMPAERVAGEIRAAGGALLLEVRLFDLYRGESIPAGHKSLAYALTYQADDRTLTDNEVKKAHEKIMGRLKHVLKAQIRDK
ncbi:MAG TPA: phenylalanine--tRNA ligase subunit beta [Gemmataceae bacterium]|nr:phenylalanine--tRNA ligase subunit beta [Gemmataceae bacterium]